MKYRLFKVAFFVASFFFLSLLSLAAREPIEGNIYWIGFSDRGKEGASSAVSLSEKALSRRLKYGICLTDNDFPVNRMYVEQLSQMGGEALHRNGFRGDGVVIAVLDEGFYGVDVHPAFDSLRASGRLLASLIQKHSANRCEFALMCVG